MEQMGGK